MEQYKRTLGDNIRKQRIIRHLTQEELADLADTETASVGRIERGQANPTLQKLVKISDALGMELSELLSVKEKDTIGSYLKQWDLNALSDQKRKAALALLQLLSCLVQDELDGEYEETIIETILQAVQHTSYEIFSDYDRAEDGTFVEEYGIRATMYTLNKPERVKEISKISTNKAVVEYLVETLNHRFVSMITFPDVVMDFVDNNYELYGML